MKHKGSANEVNLLLAVCTVTFIKTNQLIIKNDVPLSVSKRLLSYRYVRNSNSRVLSLCKVNFSLQSEVYRRKFAIQTLSDVLRQSALTIGSNVEMPELNKQTGRR